MPVTQRDPPRSPPTPSQRKASQSVAAKTMMLVASGKLSRSRGPCIGVVQPHAGPELTDGGTAQSACSDRLEPSTRADVETRFDALVETATAEQQHNISASCLRRVSAQSLRARVTLSASLNAETQLAPALSGQPCAASWSKYVAPKPAGSQRPNQIAGITAGRGLNTRGKPSPRAHDK